jgi:tetratricopeptide (TPR) repeat protein
VAVAVNDESPTNSDAQNHHAPASRNWRADHRAAAPRPGPLPELRRQAIDAYDRWGPDHPLTMTLTDHLAGAYLDQGEVRLAVTLYERTLKQRLSVLGALHPDSLISANNLAVAYRVAGAARRSLELFEQALETAQQVPYLTPFQVMSMVSNLADTLISLGREREAVQLYIRVTGEPGPLCKPPHADGEPTGADVARVPDPVRYIPAQRQP